MCDTEKFEIRRSEEDLLEWLRRQEPDREMSP